MTVRICEDTDNVCVLRCNDSPSKACRHRQASQSPYDQFRLVIDPAMMARNRELNRRENAATVMEEACAEMARSCQSWASLEFDCGNADSASEYYRDARRYLLALVGDGRGEE